MMIQYAGIAAVLLMAAIVLLVQAVRRRSPLLAILSALFLLAPFAGLWLLMNAVSCM